MAITAYNITEYPAYTTKEEIGDALMESIKGQVPLTWDVFVRLSNTDLNALSDKSDSFDDAIDEY